MLVVVVGLIPTFCFHFKMVFCSESCLNRTFSFVDDLSLFLYPNHTFDYPNHTFDEVL